MAKDKRPYTAEPSGFRLRTKDISTDGFTLLEMIVSTGIFAVLVIASMGIMISVSKAQLRSANLQAIQDNIRFSAELITKELRTGQNYQLTALCNLTSGKEISFDSTSGPRTYYLHPDPNIKALMRVKENPTPTCDNAVQFTSEDIEVENFFVQLRGQNVGPDDGQPMATIVLKITATDPNTETKTTMNLQTTVVQRIRDL